MPNKPKPISPELALNRLKRGNRRFVSSRKSGRIPARKNAKWLSLKQRGPFAIILSCSDSRAPAEIVFDQGLGDLFIIRVAGNIVAPSQVGSVEFAAATTQARLVVVMGHTECGAIQATLNDLLGLSSVPTENIQAIVERIRPHVLALTKGQKNLSPSLWRDAMRSNVLASTDHLRHGSRLLETLIRKKELQVVGAEYDIHTGKVDFFDLSTPRSKA